MDVFGYGTNEFLDAFDRGAKDMFAEIERHGGLSIPFPAVDGRGGGSSVTRGISLNPLAGSYGGYAAGYSFTVAGDDGGAMLENVSIEDEAFLSKMASGEVRLFWKDGLMVDLRCDQCTKSGKMSTTYAIEKVIEYRPHRPATQQKLDLE